MGVWLGQDDNLEPLYKPLVKAPSVASEKGSQCPILTKSPLQKKDERLNFFEFFTV
jgi:hypothetical protein